MPGQPSRVCGYPGCRTLTKTGRCEKHPKEPWEKRADAPCRLRGRRLQRARVSLFRNNPLCAECERQGRVTEATQRDHVIPLGEDGQEDEDNVQGLCDACHAAKTKDEARRGQLRA